MGFQEEERIVCGRCKEAVRIETMQASETVVRCPICGESDTLEAARREAGQHIAYVFLQSALGSLKANAPQVRYRFHAG